MRKARESERLAKNQESRLGLMEAKLLESNNLLSQKKFVFWIKRHLKTMNATKACLKMAAWSCSSLTRTANPLSMPIVSRVRITEP